MLILVSVIYQVRLNILYHGQAVYNIQYMFIANIDYFHLIYIYIYIKYNLYYKDVKLFLIIIIIIVIQTLYNNM